MIKTAQQQPTGTPHNKGPDLSGRRFGRLLVCEEASPKEYGRKNKYKVRAWTCVCDCGKSLDVYQRSLTRAKSCGCVRTEKLVGWSTKHGHASNGHVSDTYCSWHSMLLRCYDSNQKKYHLWGGRGIEVCNRWQGEHGFENFLADMGERPKGKTLDRYPDNNGNYEPGNCRWATPKEQAANRRTTANDTNK